MLRNVFNATPLLSSVPQTGNKKLCLAGIQTFVWKNEICFGKLQLGWQAVVPTKESRQNGTWSKGSDTKSPTKHQITMLKILTGRNSAMMPLRSSIQDHSVEKVWTPLLYRQTPLYDHSSLYIFFPTPPLLTFFWQYHPNEIQEKHKNKLMMVSYFFNIVTFKHVNMLFS